MGNNNGNNFSFKDKVAEFMRGRYGADDFYYFLLVAYFVLMVVNFFARSSIVSLLQTGMLIYSTFRVLSKNIPQIQRENAAFLKIFGKAKDFVNLQISRIRDRKTHVYRKCPSCKNNIRLPRQKGKHTVSCPCCKNRFDVNI